MSSRRIRGWIGFALFAVLTVAGLFVLDGPAAGVTLLVALLVFILACMAALRRQDANVVKHNERTGLVGWVGHWF